MFLLSNGACNILRMAHREAADGGWLLEFVSACVRVGVDLVASVRFASSPACEAVRIQSFPTLASA